MPIGISEAVLAASAVSAGASIFGSILGSNAASKASDQQVAMEQQALALQKPFAETGAAAGNSLAQLYGLTTPGNPGGASSTPAAFNAFTKLPAYQFPFQQGMRALNFGLASQGLLQSGAAGKEAETFGQGLASQYLMSNYVNPLLSIYGQGASSANAAAATLGNIGTAQASGTIGSANALAGGISGAGSAINQGVGNLTLYSLLAKSPQFGGGGTGGSTASVSSYQPITGPAGAANGFPSLAAGGQSPYGAY